jgi:23S rRNA pseudouridine2605 synthase
VNARGAGGAGGERSGVRLNKLLAERVGLARRKCDEAIAAGLVAVDGRPVTTPGLVLDPAAHAITFRGHPLPDVPALHHLLFHKPLGVLVTWDDPQGRRTVRDFVPRGLPRLFAVGRLDADTSGLLLLTNDGPLAHRLAHPRYEVAKTYLLTLDASPSRAQLAALRKGVDLGDGERSGPAREVVLEGAWGGGAVVRLVLAEGRNRQVRRMCEAVGLPLRSLERVAFGPLELGDLPVGATRPLTRDELRRLRGSARDPEAPSRGRTGRPPGAARRGPR